MSHPSQGRPPTITKAGVLFLFAQPDVKTMTQSEVAANFNVTSVAAGNVMRAMLDSGDLVIATKGGANGRALTYALAPAKRLGGVAPAFRPDNWKPPMQGYEAHLLGFAERAMATRRA